MDPYRVQMRFFKNGSNEAFFRTNERFYLNNYYVFG